MNLYSTQTTNTLQTTVFKSASAILALLFILSPLDSAFAQEAEVTPAPVSGGYETVSLTPSLGDISIVEPAIATPVVKIEPVVPEVISPEAEPEKVKGPKKDKETEEEVAPIDPELEPEAMSARTAAATEPEEQTLGRYVAPEVSATNGALNYRYPIAVPPGRNGLAPSHALTYDSNNKTYDSIFGIGWSIDIPYIQRVNKKGSDTMYTDDFFISSLGGELIEQSGGVYTPRTENGNFLQYEYTSDSWAVTDKQGTVYSFGDTAQARQDDSASSTRVYSWMLETVTDTNGNTISYEYFKDQGQIYPDAIKYSQDEYFEVDFIRSSSTKNQAETFRPGFGVLTQYEISDIEVYANSSLVREYEIAYSNGIIDDVQITGHVGASSVQLPETSFNYSQDLGEGFERSGVYEFPHYTAGSNDYYIRLQDDYSATGDVNGDGLIDVIKSGGVAHDPTNEAYGVWINTGSGFERSTTFEPPTYQETPSSTKYYVRLSSNVAAVRDVNGDGLVDVMYGHSSLQYDSTDQRFGVWINTGSGFERSDTIEYPHYTDGSNSYYVRLSGDYSATADVNGDGLVDVISSAGIPYASQSVAQGVWINTGSGFEKSDVYEPPIYQESTSTPAYFQKLTSVIDVNGDGLSDVMHANAGYVYNHSDQRFGVWINTGSGFERSDEIEFPNYTSGSNKIALPVSDTYAATIDANGDGLIDVVRSAGVQVDLANEAYGVWINTGSGFERSNIFHPPIQQETPTSPQYYLPLSGETTLTVDVNGDAMTDVLHGHRSLVYNASDQRFGTWINEGDIQPNLIKVTDTTGGTTDISYSTAQIQNDTHQARSVMIVVDALTTDAGNGVISTTTYEYKNADFYYADAHDRRSSGFGEMIQTNSDGSIKTTKYHQANGETGNEPTDSYALIGKVFEETMEDGGDNLFKRTRYNYEEGSLGGDASSVLTKSILTQRYDGTSSHTDTVVRYTYDEYGNVTEEDQLGEVQGSADGTFVDTGSDKRSTEIEYYEDAVNYIVGLPTKQVLKNGGVTEAETVYLYDVDGNLLEESDWIDASDYATTSYSYNSYGLVDDQTDPLGNTTSYTYDADNLYPVTVTNALLQETDQAYDYSSGKVLTTTDPNGGVVEYIYDGLDRLIEEKRTQGNGGTETVRTLEYNMSASPQHVTETTYRDGSNTQKIRTYLNGFGRTIQTKSETDTAWATVDTIYDEMGRVESTSLPYETNSVSYVDPTDETDLLSVNTYDALGRVLSTTNARGATEMDYDGFATTVTDPLNNDKIFTADPYENLVQVDEENDANTYTTNYIYSALNQLTKITDAENNIRNISYDGLGRRTQLEDLHSAADSTFGVWDFVYDDINLISTADPEGDATSYTYDGLNRVLTEDSDSTVGIDITNTYDSCTNGVGQLCSVSTADVTTTYSYWKQGLVSTSTATIDAVAYDTNTSYNRQGQPVSVTYPNSDVVTTEYNTQGLPAEVKNNGVTQASAVYGVHGKPEQLMQANDLTTQNTYDETDLYSLAQKITGYASSTTSTSSETTTSTSTEIVTSTSTIPGTTTTQFSDDFEGGIGDWTNSGNRNWYTTGDTLNLPGTSGNLIARAANCDSFCYMTLTNPIDLSTATSAELSLWRYLRSTLDNGEYGKLELYDGTTWNEVSNWSDDNTWYNETYDLSDYLVSDFNLRLTGRMNRSNERVEIDDVVIIMTAPDEIIVSTSTVQTTSTSTATSTQTNITFTDQIQNLSYTYDSAGNITDIVDASDTDTAKTQSFTYDDLYRLTGVTTTNTASGTTPYTQTFAYSPIGNITNFDGTTLAYTDNGYNNPHAVTSVGSTTHSYTNNGNLNNDGVWSHTWDYRNRLVGSADGTDNLSYTYNHNNERTKLVDGADTTIYPFSSYQIENGTPKLYLSLGDMTVATVEGGAATYVHTDHLGGTTLTTDNTGVITETLDYMPYGETRIDTGTSEEDSQFTGYKKDSTTGLNYSSARYYNPLRGAFISQDPVALALGNRAIVEEKTNIPFNSYLRNPQTHNSYSYAANNPLKFIDKKGEYIELAISGTAFGGSASAGVRISTKGLNIFGSAGFGGGFGAYPVSASWVRGEDVAHETTVSDTVGGGASYILGFGREASGEIVNNSFEADSVTNSIQIGAGADLYARREKSIPILGKQKGPELQFESYTSPNSTPNFAAPEISEYIDAKKDSEYESTISAPKETKTRRQERDQKK